RPDGQMVSGAGADRPDHEDSRSGRDPIRVEQNPAMTATWSLPARLLILALITSACSPVVEFQAKPVTYPAVTAFNLAVVLELSPQLLSAEWKTGSGIEIIVPLGQALSQNSEALARALFSQVQVSKDGRIPSAFPADAVLVPRVVSITHTRPLFIF